MQSLFNVSYPQLTLPNLHEWAFKIIGFLYLYVI